MPIPSPKGEIVARCYDHWHVLADLHHLVPDGRSEPVTFGERHLERHGLHEAYKQLRLVVLRDDDAQTLGVKPYAGFSVLYREQATDTQHLVIVLWKRVLGTSQPMAENAVQAHQARDAASAAVAADRRDYTTRLSSTLALLDDHPDACMAIIRAHSQLMRYMEQAQQRWTEHAESSTDGGHDATVTSLECYRQVQDAVLQSDGYWWQEQLLNARRAVPDTSLARTRLSIFVLAAKQLVKAQMALGGTCLEASWHDLRAWEGLTARLLAAPDDFALDDAGIAEVGRIGRHLHERRDHSVIGPAA